MLLYCYYNFERSAAYKALQLLRTIVLEDGIWRPKEDVQFVFLCGANIKAGIPSKRRQDLLDFSSKQLPYSKFFLAEAIFDLLKTEGHKENILDLENELSQFADFIILVLESESAFCELGAFTTSKDLREKLIIINDLQHKESGSFINLGPIKAIEETTSGDQKILYYDMDENGRFRGDGIGDVYSALHGILHKKPKIRRSRVKKCNPNRFFSKDTLRFVHDLVYFTGPIYLEELSMVVQVLFDRVEHRKIENHIGLLCAIEELVRTENGLYKSNQRTPYFEYGTLDTYDILASFKNMYFRNDSARLK